MQTADEYEAVRAKLNDRSLSVDYGPGLEALEAERLVLVDDADIHIGDRVLICRG